MTSTNLELMIKFPNNKREQIYSPPKGFKDKYLIKEGMLMYIHRSGSKESPRCIYLPCDLLLELTKTYRYRKAYCKTIKRGTVMFCSCYIKIPPYNSKFIETLSRLVYKHSIGALE
jgi:hypothetical protein